MSYKLVVYGMDGNQFFAHREDFINLQLSLCGFGDTNDKALIDLLNQEKIESQGRETTQVENFYIEKCKREELEQENVVLKNELARIRNAAERLLKSDEENKVSIEENIAGKYMLRVLEGENFQ